MDQAEIDVKTRELEDAKTAFSRATEDTKARLKALKTNVQDKAALGISFSDFSTRKKIVSQTSKDAEFTLTQFSKEVTELSNDLDNLNIFNTVNFGK